VSDLTDGDFEFLMAWQRVHSFPDVPLLVNWTCSKVNWVSKEDRHFYTGKSKSDLLLKVAGYKQEVCDTENNEIVHQSETIVSSLDDDFTEIDSYLELDFPRVKTLVEYYELIKEHPELE
ncbi:hypothetical protein RZS08_02730, partial [Arthrospira platensis SPKY1]|nr:hypothetical protein [Arthrospira platensis SPKY1]